MDARPLLNLVADRIRALPLLVLYITDGCNSRCATCDIWRLPRRNMNLDLAERLAGEFHALGGQAVVLSGGEAMQHPAWPRIASMFRQQGARITLLTNGLYLKTQARTVVDNIDTVTVSLDAATPETYLAIRGVDALPLVLEGMQAVAAAGVTVTTRTTLQRANYREMPAIIDLALNAGARQVSFLAVDVSNTEAFGPRFGVTPIKTQSVPESPALRPEDLPAFAALLDTLEHSHAAQFAARQIAENMAKLRRLHRYFEAVCGLRPFEGPPCNAPHISTVIEVDGRVRPCYFLPTVGSAAHQPLQAALNSPEAVAMRRTYRAGERPECARCVCPLHRGPRALLRGM